MRGWTARSADVARHGRNATWTKTERCELAALLIGLLGLALVDSLNPSTIGFTVYLLLVEGRYVARVLTYLSGVFATYLGIGVLLVSGRCRAG